MDSFSEFPVKMAVYGSPLGNIVMASRGQGLSGLWFEGQRHFGFGHAGCSSFVKLDDNPDFVETAAWLNAYFSGQSPLPEILNLDLRGTDFRLRVWNALLSVPYGSTVSYSQLAVKAGYTPRAVRAVATAVGLNPVSIVVPCHRIVRADGHIGEYAGGAERKRWLLDHERGISPLLWP